MDPVKKMIGLTKCYYCDGSGMDENNKTCKKCQGAGSYVDDRY